MRAAQDHPRLTCALPPRGPVTPVAPAARVGPATISSDLRHVPCRTSRPPHATVNQARSDSATSAQQPGGGVAVHGLPAWGRHLSTLDLPLLPHYAPGRGPASRRSRGPACYRWGLHSSTHCPGPGLLGAPLVITRPGFIHWPSPGSRSALLGSRASLNRSPPRPGGGAASALSRHLLGRR
ncbi:hypothetical protein NDU88_006108 [Pleurodeles waltl]|uniref:Uncharacterized protein n=1 Tax=Pleurodeles waltl TaxID=8319 RepID=A0AAV7TD06_PLEWA|nr:hypothetical protein NDU88_006108 [Pleurodeles waltl]